MLSSIDCFFSIGKKNSFLSRSWVKCLIKEDISDLEEILVFFPFLLKAVLCSVLYIL